MRTTFAATRAGDSLRDDPFDDHQRISLFLDVDGTLLDLARRPDEVTIPDNLLAIIAAASDAARGALALVSGRPIADLDRLFAPLRLRAAGVHGAEMRLAPDDDISPAPGARGLPPGLWAGLADIVAAFPGTFAENKRFSYAVHYREAPTAGAALRLKLERLLDAFADDDVAILEAHAAFELKSPRVDKGRAVAAFLSTPAFAGRTPVYIGDDETDEAGFAAVLARGGRAFSVGRPRRGASATFARPDDVRGWLAAFAARGAPA